MGYVDGKPVCSFMYIIRENGDSFSNMMCAYKQYRGLGYPFDLTQWGLAQIAKDPRVKNKEVTFAELRLEMVPYWEKKLGDDFHVISEKYMGENGLW